MGEVDPWAGFEAMERGVWLSPYKKSLGKSTVVGEFEMNLPPEIAEEVIKESLEEYLDWWYDYAGIGIWAAWILFKRWFGSFVNWFHLVFRPKAADKALFCSGLALKVVQKGQDKHSFEDYGMKALTARTSTPRNEIDICFSHPKSWTYIGGVTPLEEVAQGDNNA